MVLALAEVLGAEELWQADDLRPVARGLADEVCGVVEVLLDGGRAGHLDECDANGISGHGFLTYANWVVRFVCFAKRSMSLSRVIHFKP